MPDIYVAGKDSSGSGKGKTSKERAKKSAKGEEKSDQEVLLTTEGGLPLEPTKNPIAAFSYYPSRVNFIGADSKEKIVLILRRHPVTNIPWMITALFMVFVPVFVSFLGFVEQIPVGYQIVSLMIWYLLTLAFVIEEFLSWFFNVNIITDERVFDVDFVNLVYREITDANIDQIQDVTVRVGSVIRTMFNYGDVMIQTASEVPQIEFLAVPKPDLVAQILRELRVQEEQEKLEGRVR